MTAPTPRVESTDVTHLTRLPLKNHAGIAGLLRPFAHVARQAIIVLAAALPLSAGTGAAMAQTVTYDLATTSVMRINLPMSQAVTVVISEPVGKVVSADPTIADAQPITDRSIYLVGRPSAPQRSTSFPPRRKPVGLLAVEVGADTADMAASIRAAVPSAKVTVSTVNGRVRLGGTVPDIDTMDKVLAVVAQYGSPRSSTP
jgi:pilus assembly protein CpaC